MVEFVTASSGCIEAIRDLRDNSRCFNSSFFGLLSDQEWVDILSYVGENFPCFLWGARSRAAWALQLMCLLTTFSKECISFNPLKFVRIPTTEDVKKCLDIMEKFNKNAYYATPKTYKEISQNWTRNSKIFKKNLQISHHILVFIFSFLEDYLKDEDIEKDYSTHMFDIWWTFDSWKDFYDNYYDKFSDRLKLIMREFIDNANVDLIVDSEDNLNEFIKLLLILSYTMRECQSYLEGDLRITVSAADHFYGIRNNAFRIYQGTLEVFSQKTINKIKNQLGKYDSGLEDSSLKNEPDSVENNVSIKSTKVKVEPVVQEVPKEKSIFTFNLFGYKFSLKKEIPEPVKTADEFEDFMEY